MATKRGILAYTTDVDATKTIGEISRLLIKKQASSIRTDYEGGRAIAVEFTIQISGQPIDYRLVPNIAGAARKLPGGGALALCSPRVQQQAERTAWRILFRWVEAQIAMVEMNQAEMGQVFLPYAVVESGRTVYSLFVDRQQGKLLGSGK